MIEDQQREFRVRVVTEIAYEGTVTALSAAQATIIASDFVRRGAYGEGWRSMSLGISRVEAVLASEHPS